MEALRKIYIFLMCMFAIFANFVPMLWIKYAQ